MRLLGNILLLILALASGWGIYYQLTTEALPEGSPYLLSESNKPQRSQLYIFNDNNKIEYTLSQSPEKLWLSSIVLFTDASGRTIQHDFELLFEAIAGSGDIIKSRRLNFSAQKADQVELPDLAEAIPEFFTMDINVQVSAPQNVYFKIDQDIKKVRVSLLQKSKQIANIGLRLYQKVKRSSRLTPIDSWERLSNAQRRKLTEYFPYNLAELSTQEKANLARFRWQPVIPVGTPGLNYILASLFRVPNDIIQNNHSLLDTQNHNADENRHVTFPIHEAGQYTLSATHLFGNRTFNLSFRWHSLNQQRSQLPAPTNIEFSGSSASHTLKLERGLLEITSSIPVSLELHSKDTTVIDHQHITPTYVLNDNAPLIYSIVHSDPHPTPVKVSFQQYADSEIAPLHKGTLTMQLLDSNGEIWQEIKQDINNEPANYYQTTGTEFFTWLSKKQDSFIRVPSHIRTLKIHSKIPTLVGVSTRPESIPTIRNLPEENRNWFDFEGRIPDWYSINPDNKNTYINQGKMATIRYYHQPLTPKEMENTNWQFDSLLANRPGLINHELMVPITHLTNLEPSPLLFQALPSGQLIKSLKHNGKQNNTTLFFIKNNNQPEQIAWSINNQQQGPFWVAGKWGMTELPIQLENGSAVNWQNDSILWFANALEEHDEIISNVGSAEKSKSAYVKRRTVALSVNNPLTITMNKTTKEQTVSFSLYPTSTKNIEVLVELFLTNQERTLYSDSHTLSKRIFVITPSDQLSGFKLFSSDRLQEREVFYFPLLNDIPPQEISIRITLLSGDTAYLNAIQKVIETESIIERFRSVNTRSKNVEK